VAPSGLGELARHAADLHDRQLRRVGQHHRHLEDDAEGVADVVRMELGEAFGAVAALEQERLARGNLGQIRPVRSRASPAKHQRRIMGKLRRGGVERGRSRDSRAIAALRNSASFRASSSSP
jgi:hypothetical protein